MFNYQCNINTGSSSIIFFYAFYLIYLRSKILDTQEIESFVNKFGTFFGEFNGDGITSWYFYPLFLLKRASMLFIIFFISTPIVQLTLSMTFTLAVRNIQSIIYLIAVRPFTDQIRSLSLIAGEICVFLFYLVLSFQFILGDNLGTTKEIVCISIMLINVGINISFSILSGAAATVTWIRNRQLKKSNAVSPIAPAVITESEAILTGNLKLKNTH